MQKSLTVLAALWLTVLPTSSLAQNKYSFSPQASNVLGTTQSNKPTPFTRIWTQMAGELAISRFQERYEGIATDNLKLVQLLSRYPPVVAYMNVAWSNQLLHLLCTADLLKSNPLEGRFLIVLTVAEGSLSSIPVGTVFALSQFHMWVENGVDTMTADVQLTPGILPSVLPSSLTMTDQIIPDLWRTPYGPGKVVAEHTFTSVQPGDGSAPLTYKVRSELPVN